jgi:phage terminase large subunit
MKSEQPLVFVYGSAGSGKSRAVAQKVVTRIVTEAPHKILCVRKVANTLLNSMFAEIKAVIYSEGIEKNFEFNVSPMRITYIPNGNEVLFVGLEEPERLKSISGITSAWIDEATELSNIGEMLQIQLRMRGIATKYFQLICSFNPISTRNWLYVNFFKEDVEGVRVEENGEFGRPQIFHSTHLDNAFIEKQYHDVLNALSRQDYNMHKVYALGEWAELDRNGIIFNNWASSNCSRDISNYDTITIGLDFGFTHPSACLVIGKKGEEVYVLHEIYCKGLTNTELMQKIVTASWYARDIQIIADGAEPDRIKEMKQSGMNVKAANKSKGSVKDSIDWLRRYRIVIHPDCTNTIKEISEWKYQSDRDGTIREEPVNFQDDAMSALRYGIEPYRIKQGQMRVVSGFKF